jgi:hypothetical protein
MSKILAWGRLSVMGRGLGRAQGAPPSQAERDIIADEAEAVFQRMDEAQQDAALRLRWRLYRRACGQRGKIRP